MELPDISTAIPIDEVSQIEALNAFVTVVCDELDPEYDAAPHDAALKIQGALSLYRKTWGDLPTAHTGELLECLQESQDIADTVNAILEASDDLEDEADETNLAE